MRVLLTGGAGFVGINIAEALLADSHELVILDTRPLPVQAETALLAKGAFRQIQASVLESEKIASALEDGCIDTVVHAAAVTPGPQREREQFADILHINLLGTMNVLQAAKEHGVKQFLYISSVAVYGDSAQRYKIVGEDVPLNPANVYEISKFASERSVSRYAQLYGMNAHALRLGDVFGAWEFDTGVRDTMSAPCQVLHAALAGGGTALWKAGRTGWVYVKDIANSVLAVLKSETLQHFVYNSSSLWQWSIADWCDLCAAHIPGFRWRMSGREEGTIHFHAEQDNGVFDIARLRQDTGFSPVYDLEHAFADYLQWARTYPELA